MTSYTKGRLITHISALVKCPQILLTWLFSDKNLRLERRQVPSYWQERRDLKWPWQDKRTARRGTYDVFDCAINVNILRACIFKRLRTE